MQEVAATQAGKARAETTRDSAGLRRTVVVALLVCAGYYFTAEIGFAFALQPGVLYITPS